MLPSYNGAVNSHEPTSPYYRCLPTSKRLPPSEAVRRGQFAHRFAPTSGNQRHNLASTAASPIGRRFPILVKTNLRTELRSWRAGCLAPRIPIMAESAGLFGYPLPAMLAQEAKWPVIASRGQALHDRT